MRHSYSGNAKQNKISVLPWIAVCLFGCALFAGFLMIFGLPIPIYVPIFSLIIGVCAIILHIVIKIIHSVSHAVKHTSTKGTVKRSAASYNASTQRQSIDPRTLQLARNTYRWMALAGFGCGGTFLPPIVSVPRDKSHVIVFEKHGYDLPTESLRKYLYSGQPRNEREGYLREIGDSLFGRYRAEAEKLIAFDWLVEDLMTVTDISSYDTEFHIRYELTCLTGEQQIIAQEVRRTHVP